ncbi:MAG: ribosome biogenesis GTPase Der [Thermodesulfatator sp.]|nr:MAG: ribosome biogenesis GTPase Der [Thermodesulfatator sp.]
MAKVALLGRPNVGKSTLFNTLIGERKAVVERTPGVTRDRLYGEAEIDGRRITFIDTGGLEPQEGDLLKQETLRQAEAALREADLVLLVVDAKAGLTPLDEEVAELVRTSGKPLILVVNKVDGKKELLQLGDFYALGLEPLVPISAKHRRGLEDLKRLLLERLPEEGPTPREGLPPIRVAILGRPNVGKSTLLNRLVGYERMIVSDIPGTTRDSIDTLLELPDGRRYLLIDTAGIRRRARIKERVEKFSVDKAFEALERAEVALLLLTAEEGITDQDQKILSQIEKRHKACLILVNKWDLLDGRREEGHILLERIRYGARFVPWAPILTISAKTGRRVGEVLPLVDEIYAEYSRRIPTAQVNRALEAIRKEKPLYTPSGKRLKFYYATQAEIRPPTVVIFTNYPEEIPKSVERFVRNRLREYLGFSKTPLKVLFRHRR